MIPFTTTFKSLRQGAADEDAAQAIQEAIAAVRATGSPAEVHIKLKFEPNGTSAPGELQSIMARDTITTKLPVPPNRASIFFVTEDNELSRSQQTIPGVEPVRPPTAQPEKG